MSDALFIAATGMHTQQKSVDTIANNLANVNTPGFKKGRVSFEDLVSNEVSRVSRKDDTDGASRIWRGNGVGIFSLAQIFTAGELKKTDLPMDMAIQGNGFIEMTGTDGGSVFGRGGSMRVNADGFLTNADGLLVKPNIHIGKDAKSVTVQADGRVLVQGQDQATASEAGRMELTHFSDPSALLALGNGLYQPTVRSGDAMFGKPGEDGLGTLAQGFIEASNVNLIEEMVGLMAAQRAYESNVKVIQAADEMLAMSNNLRK